MHDAQAEQRRRSLRAWRRGTREMDLILGPFADARLPDLPAAELALFDELLAENDHDLYRWITARIAAADDTPPASRGPHAYAPLLDLIAVHASGRLRPAGPINGA
jgi:antitoxin CptB